MIEFVPSKMFKLDINTCDISLLSKKYTDEIQHRTRMAEAAGEHLKQAMYDCGIYSGNMALSAQSVAAILAPTVGPGENGIRILRTPIRLEFQGEENNTRANVIVSDNIFGLNDFDVTIQVFKSIDGHMNIYDYTQKKWKPVEDIPVKHELISTIEMETGIRLTPQEEEKILKANKQIIELKESFPAPGLLRYSTYSVPTDNGLNQEIRMCLIPSNTNTTGVTVLLDWETNQLSLCQKFIKEELSFLFQAAPADKKDDLKKFENEWDSVCLVDRADDLVPILTKMLDHYTAGFPTYVFPLSLGNYTKVFMLSDGNIKVKNSVSETKMTELEKKQLQKLKQKLHVS